jgi:Na+/H+ antiporter NhaC
MKAMSRTWPKIMGLLALAVALWWALSLLQPNTDSLTSLTYQKWGRDLAAMDAMTGEDGAGLAKVMIDGGQACEDAFRPRLDALGLSRGGATLKVRCGLSEGRVFYEADRIMGRAAPIRIAEASHRLPSAFSLFPPLLAIAMAFIFGNILPALITGIGLGALLVEDFAPVAALTRTVVDYGWGTVTDPFALYVCAFTLALLGLVNISVAMAGIRGVIDKLAGLATGVRSTQLVTAFMGFAVFFDDYANTVVVGGAARPLTDEKRISREKLAYIVDSTAAPISGVALVSTWIGIEVQAFEDLLPALGTFSELAPSGYAFFLEVLPYRFYCYFAVLLVLLVAITGRDYGPMLKAERRCRRGGQPKTDQVTGDFEAPPRAEVTPKEGIPARWINGVLPIGVVILLTSLGSVPRGAEVLVEKGKSMDWASPADWMSAFIHVDESVQVLFWAAIGGTIFTVILARAQKLLTLGESTSAWTRGVLGMLPTMAILVLVMALQQVIKDLHAAEYLAAQIGDVAPALLPVMVFGLAGVVAFATGTSWGTMLILMPFVLPTGAALLEGHPDGAVLLFLLGASVLDGAIFGDHCSLVSDTTVMSSIASGCDHTAHVRTQLPYALLAMVAAAGAGYGWVAYSGGTGIWLAYPIGLAGMWAWLHFMGKSVGEAEDLPPTTREIVAAPDEA